MNKIDTMTGYLGFTDGDADGIVTQAEINAVPGSLLGKAKMAQTVFDNKFLLPFAPDRPDFFLVPGNNQVTVLWNRSATETTPDPFFAIASQPQVIDPLTGLPVVNALYDPNFRGFDVEGYRIYRGRVDNPSELQLIAQFDYAPDASGKGIFTDFRGVINPVPGCAPELRVQTTCAVPFAVPTPGAAAHRVNADRPGGHDHPGGSGWPACCSRTARRRSFPASSTRPSRTSRAAGWRRASPPTSSTAACRSCSWTTTSGTACGTSTPSRRST